MRTSENSTIVTWRAVDFSGLKRYRAVAFSASIPKLSARLAGRGVHHA